MAQLPRVGDQFGRYHIDSQIGVGGMGVVFGATDTKVDRQVALKVVSSALGDSGDFQRRFEREAALLARLDSPHVIAIFDYGSQDGCPYIATQWVRGGDLGALIQARGPMPPPLALSVCSQVADALHDAHRAGVVHRDVKPTNVLLREADSSDLHAYLCDFGIARSETGRIGQDLTVPGSVTGTWGYLAPEVGQGRPATPASDIYALGCLLWVALTGAPPYGGTDIDIALAHQQAPIPQLAGSGDFERRINEILTRSLAKDPAERYADADRMRVDLLAAAEVPAGQVRPVAPPPTATPTRSSGAGGSRPGSTSPSTPSPTPPSTGRRRAPLIAAAAAAVVLAVVGGVLAATQLGDDEPTSDPTPTAGGSEGSEGSDGTEDPEPRAEGAVPGDLDGDGLGDFQVYAGGESVSTALRWTSTGAEFTDFQTEDLPPPETVQRRRALGDVDGDDLMDQITVDNPRNRGLGPLAVTVELGSGESLEQSLDYPTGGNYSTVSAADADGDGLDDLIVVTFSRGAPLRTYVARSTGEGFEDLAEWLDTGLRIQESIEQDEGRVDTIETAYGDVDGDGMADAVVLHTTGFAVPLTDVDSEIELYLSDGERFVSDGATRTFMSSLIASFDIGDVDGDGDGEAVLTYFQGSSPVVNATVLDYDGGWAQPRVRGGVTGADGTATDDRATGLSDVDGDGMLDLVGLRQSGPTEFTLSVAISRGNRFANPQDWATETFDPAPYDRLDALGEVGP